MFGVVEVREVAGPRAAMNDRSTQLDPTQTEASALREMLLVAAPTVATMVSYTLAQFVDGLMVSRLGDGALAAQGNGGIIAFVPISILTGIFGVINTYVSQNFGAGRPERSSPRHPTRCRSRRAAPPSGHDGLTARAVAGRPGRHPCVLGSCVGSAYIGGQPRSTASGRSS